MSILLLAAVIYFSEKPWDWLDKLYIAGVSRADQENAMLPSVGIPSRAADTLPAELSDTAYWKLISDFSEPTGSYPFQVVTSNELSYQTILPELTKLSPPGGVYLGVGPEQNFTYIAALRPKIAFIIDTRRDMMPRTPDVQGHLQKDRTRCE